jgi:hypothetical protein
MKRPHIAIGSFALLAAFTLPAASTPATPGDWIGQVDARPESGWQSAVMEITVTGKTGAPQVREAMAFSRIGDGKRENAVYFRAPTAMKKTAFLSVESSGDGEQWLYVPALQTVRRVPTANRGDAFLGTDLSYEDVQRVGKIHAHDYTFTEAQVVSESQVEITGLANEQAARELGHTKAQWSIDPHSAYITGARYFDATGTLIKQAKVSGIREVGGFWIADTIEVQNLRTGSKTLVHFKDVVLDTPFDADILSTKGIESGKGLK